MTVVKFPVRNQNEEQGNIRGVFICLACKHEFEGTDEAPHDNDIECPNCGAFRVAAKYPFAPAKGRIVWCCGQCRSQQFYIVKIDDEPNTSCIGCGLESPLIKIFP